MLVVCPALVLLAQISLAQSKVAVINLQRAVLDTAEIKKASADMEARYKPRQAEREKLEKELAEIQQKLEAGPAKLTPQQETDLRATGQRKQRDYQRMTEDLQTDVERERNEILSRSTQKMGDVVKKLAEERTFDVVIDISNTVYFKPALDITADAIAAFDQAYPVK
jgi:outer membrane protein